jgi:hypothetical protein
VEGDGWIDRSQPSSSCELFLVVSSPLALRFVPLCLASGVHHHHHHSHLVARGVRACVREIPNPKSVDDGGRRM